VERRELGGRRGPVLRGRAGRSGLSGQAPAPPTLYVSVVGPGRATAVQTEAAGALGRGLARLGAAVVTGGLGGVMAAASRGAAEAGGLVVALLPGAAREEANPWATVVVPTGLGEGRNALVVRTSDVVVAVGGSWGTLSEVALAARAGVPVLVLGGTGAWSVTDAYGTGPPGLTDVDTVGGALAAVRSVAERVPG
jgi:uncharacterized protein (TIGR00725 family)